MELELVNNLGSLVVSFVFYVLLRKLFVEIVVHPRRQLHLINKVKNHLSADAFHLGKCNILVR
jgi:hypothetical protein